MKSFKVLLAGLCWLLAAQVHAAGKVRAIVLHGFAGNPFEVRGLVRYIQPYADEIDLPTLKGFGSTAAEANKATYEDWRGTLVESDAKGKPGDQVILIGFSTGATAVIDFLLNSPESLDRVKAVILLSPYLRTHSRVVNGLNNVLSLFTDTASPMVLFELSLNWDLSALIAYPDQYTEMLPLKAAKQVVAWGKHVRKRIAALDRPLDVPVFIAYSEDDRTIHTKSIPTMMAKLFVDPQYYVYEKKLKIPHQIAVPSVNPYLFRLGYAISNFLSSLEQ